ncbi:unnamed protein product [Dibothriocephalus latus]|uniref:Uncharacterized protein n=1 Tax=Dibothriocephalus latus TaxID=60516 RepID=A0A3P7M4V0_DIBLA|nr:unnamed protein product [Dibothriocephalus latus]
MRLYEISGIVSGVAPFLDLLHFFSPEQVPPAPPRPDFDASRAKLQRLGKSEGTMTKQDMQKLKAELEA